MRDMKAALGNASKPDTTHVRTVIQTYIARACEYGSAKYERGNYMRPTEQGTVKSNFIRFGGYLRSVKTHVDKTLDNMELHLSGDPNLEDEAGMLAAAFAPDEDITPGAPVGASMLPHVAHAAAALMMAVVQATLYGLLPEDPGQPWTEKPKVKTYDPAKVVVKFNGEEIVGFAEGDSVFLAADPQPPEDYRPKCPHGLLIGRRCVDCGEFAESNPLSERDPDWEREPREG